MAFHVGQRDPNIPPPHLLDALRRARRPQFHDPCVKALLAQWKKLGDPIEYVDLNQVAAILRAENPSARTRRKIVAAVEAAGIEIHNCDAWRQRLAKRRMHVQLTPEGQLKRIEERRWRWPEKWDNDRRQGNRVRVRRGPWNTSWSASD